MKTINFAPYLKKLVLNGKKTQTRRPVKGEPKYKLGEVVNVEGTDCNIIVTGVRGERLKNEVLDTRKEGLLDNDKSCFTLSALIAIDDFFEIWDSFYSGTKYASKNNPLVWVYDFEKWED